CGGSRRGDTSCNSCRPRPLLSGAWAYTFPGSLLSVASAFARAFVSRDGAVPVDSFAGAAGSLHLHIGLHFGLRHLGLVVAGEAVVRLEADGCTDLELAGGEHLLHLTREVRVLQELTALVGDHAEEAVLRFFDLREEVVHRLARQLHAAHEFLQVIGGLGRLFDANLDGSLEELGNDAVEAAAPVARVLLAHAALAPGQVPCAERSVNAGDQAATRRIRATPAAAASIAAIRRRPPRAQRRTVWPSTSTA